MLAHLLLPPGCSFRGTSDELSAWPVVPFAGDSFGVERGAGSPPLLAHVRRDKAVEIRSEKILTIFIFLF